MPTYKSMHGASLLVCDEMATCKDSLPEWSKGVDSSSTSASCVGSNPTAVTAGEAFLDSATHGCAMTMK